eukprot:scaffold950_cov360-Pavlova_lutheri.AAC.5
MMRRGGTPSTSMRVGADPRKEGRTRWHVSGSVSLEGIDARTQRETLVVTGRRAVGLRCPVGDEIAQLRVRAALLGSVLVGEHPKVLPHPFEPFCIHARQPGRTSEFVHTGHHGESNGHRHGPRGVAFRQRTQRRRDSGARREEHRGGGDAHDPWCFVFDACHVVSHPLSQDLLHTVGRSALVDFAEEEQHRLEWRSVVQGHRPQQAAGHGTRSEHPVVLHAVHVSVDDVFDPFAGQVGRRNHECRDGCRRAHELGRRGRPAASRVPSLRLHRPTTSSCVPPPRLPNPPCRAQSRSKRARRFHRRHPTSRSP